MADTPVVRFLYDLALHPDLVFRRAVGGAGELVHALVLLIVVTALVLAAGWALIGCMVRLRDRRLVKGGRRILISTPPEVTAKGGEVLWTALHGLIRPAWRRLVAGQPFLVWEVTACPERIEVSMYVPQAIPLAYVERAVESAWPGASVMEAGAEAPFGPSGAKVQTCSMGLALGEWLSIGAGPDNDPLRLVLAALGNLAEGESSVIQVVARPATCKAGAKLVRRCLRATGERREGPIGWLFDRSSPNQTRGVNPASSPELRDARSKAESCLWQTTIRLGFSAPTSGQAKVRVHSLATAFSIFRDRNFLARGRTWRGAAAIRGRRMGKGILLSAEELACLASLPLRPLPGFDLAGSRAVAPPRSLATSGRVLGGSNSGTGGREVAISVADCRHHFHILGETGTGKSTLLANLVLQDAAAGRAAVVIDPKGDLVEAILQRLPEGAEERTCLLDPTHPAGAFGLNVLSGADPDLVADQVTELFRRIYERHWGPRSDDLLRSACLTLSQIPGATMVEIPFLFTNAVWRREVRARLTDPVLRGFWESFDAQTEARRQEDIKPLMNKLRAFVLRRPVRAIVGQSEPKRQLDELIESGGLVLVRIPKGLLGEDTSRLLGGLVVARTWQAAMARADRAEARRGDVALYVDEMHNYLTLPRSFEDLLAEARGYRLSLVLAHQHLGQLDRSMADALAANARTKVVFACSPTDARRLEEHFEPSLSAHDLSHLPAFVAACRPFLSGANGNPFTLRTLELGPGSAQRAVKVRLASGRLFGAEPKAVEAEIRQRQMRPEATLLPTVGTRDVGHSLDHPIDQPDDHSSDQPWLIGGGDDLSSARAA